MKLESLDNYKRDSSNFRILASVVVVASVCGNVIIYYLNRKEVEAAYSRIWVVDKNQRPYLANAQNSFDYDGRIYEYEEAVREFYENGFSCDDSNINKNGKSSNLERALHLSVRFENGEAIEDLWSEENMVGNVLENNWVYQAESDSILFDLENQPTRGYAFGKQTITMRRQVVVRNMHFSFEIFDVSKRTRNNPFAAKIDKIDIFNNSVVYSERR